MHQQHSWASRTSSLPAHQHLSSSPVQAFNENGPNSKSEARYKLPSFLKSRCDR
jgi:hypothetical protein